MMNKIGKILEPNTFSLRTHIGEAVGEDGIKYELLTMVSGNPAIRSEQSKQIFVLGWDEIIELAIDAGIDEIDGAQA